jgi:molybdenum cofactor biosynthesis enzyme MoaA
MESDMYFYIFVLSDDQIGAFMNSDRPATLEAIKHTGGEPLVDSQIVVDRTQL